jgi:hypothetical protein
MASLRRNEGWFMRDERLAYGPGAIFESATIQCAHCNVTVILNPKRTRQRGYCQKCDAYVCDNRVCNTMCTPIHKLLEIGMKNPGLPVLLRGADGELLFDVKDGS